MCVREAGGVHCDADEAMIRLLKKIGLLQGAILALLCAAVVYISTMLVRDLAMWVDSWSWEHAAGVVTSTRYLSRANLHEINYRYEVGGEWHRGEVVRQSARRVGDPVRVLYNPESPDESALTRSDLLGMDQFLHACYLLIIVGSLWGMIDGLHGSARAGRRS